LEKSFRPRDIDRQPNRLIDQLGATDEERGLAFVQQAPLPIFLLIATALLTIELAVILVRHDSSRSVGTVIGDRFAHQRDLLGFLRQLKPDDISRIKIIANTGQSTVQSIISELRPLIAGTTFERLGIDILLRSPSNSDQQRSAQTMATITEAHTLDTSSASTKSVTVRHRFYSATLPFRSVIVEHTDGARSAFLSFYGWTHNGAPRARDAATDEAIIVTKTKLSHILLDVCFSWFTHLWGRHNIHTIVFDFDDTLFSTTEPQVNAWVAAIRKNVRSGALAQSDLDPQFAACLDDDEQVRARVRDVFLTHQNEGDIFSTLVPDAALRAALAPELREDRLEVRNLETLTSAAPAPNIRPTELVTLSEEYALVIVSATSEDLIRKVLEKWGVNVFPYIIGRDAQLQPWREVALKTQNLIRVSNLLGVPLDRMVFVGDSDADYRSARQLGVKFIENRFNAEFYRRQTLIKDPAPEVDGILPKECGETALTELIKGIDDRS